MSENDYSKKVKKLIEEWGELNCKKLEYPISNISIKNTLLPIRSSGNQKQSINYKPDGVYTIQYKEKIVFEILDTQIETKTIADLVRCIFNPPVSDIVFIVKDKDAIKEVLRTSKVILDNFDIYLNLKDTETKRNETPINVNVIKITESDAKNKNNFFKIFGREMKKIIEG